MEIDHLSFRQEALRRQKEGQMENVEFSEDFTDLEDVEALERAEEADCRQQNG
jgi:hypothetical protein